MFGLNTFDNKKEVIEFEELPCLEILKDLGIDPKKYIGGTSLRLELPPDYFDMQKVNEQAVEDFKKLMKTLPEIPDELANSEEYKSKGIAKKPEPIIYTNFGEDQEDELEEVILEETPSPRIKEAKVTNGFFSEEESKESTDVIPPYLPEDRKIAQNLPDDSAPSMLDLVREMEARRNNDQENTHPNEDSPNNSFESDDILDALEAKDEDTETAADTDLKTLDNMNEEEFKNEIESVLLPTLNLDTGIVLGNEEKAAPQEESKLSLAQRIQAMKLEDPNCFEKEKEKEENTFKYNTDLNENMQDIISVPIRKQEVVYSTPEEDEEEKEPEKVEFTQIMKFEFDE